MAWPNLSRRPKNESKTTDDNVIKHDTESGHRPRRPKYSRTLSTFVLSYDLLDATDAGLLLAHFDLVGTHTSFSWTDKQGVSRTVLYDKPLKSTESYTGWYSFDTITLVEV